MDSDWLSSHFTKAEQNTIRFISTVSAALEMKRVETGKTQKEFSKAYGIPRRKIRRWESRDYDFRVSEIAYICEKLGIIIDYHVE